MRRSEGEGFEIFVQDPKITYLRNCPNNCNPKKPLEELDILATMDR